MSVYERENRNVLRRYLKTASDCAAVTWGVVKFMCSVWFSDVAVWFVSPPSLSRDRKWPRLTKYRHSRVVCLGLECNRVLLKFGYFETIMNWRWYNAGNDALHWLTAANNMTSYELRVDLEDFNGTSRYAQYSTFKVASASLKYKMVSLGSYTGTAGIIPTLYTISNK